MSSSDVAAGASAEGMGFRAILVPAMALAVDFGMPAVLLLVSFLVLR